MKNTYEFNIEDINSVIIVTKDFTQYTTTFNRKFEDNKPTEEFIETYCANSIRDDDGTKNINLLCTRCGTWRKVSHDQLSSCESCTFDYEDMVSEDEIIEIISSYINDEMFWDVMIFINGKQIE